MPETWTGTNGAAWPTAWTTFHDATIQGNKGRLTDTTGGFATAWWAGMTPVADVDFTVTFAATPGVVRIGLAAEQTINWYVPANGHIARVNIGAGGVESIQLLAYTASSGTEIAWAPFTPIPAGTGDTWTFRMQRTGATVQAKIWATGTTEPTGWTATGTDPNPHATTTDRVWLTFSDGGGTGHADFDDLTVGATGGGEEEPPPPPGDDPIATDGTDQSAALQSLLDAAAARGGGIVDVSHPGETITLDSGITVPRGVQLRSDPSTILDFSGIGTTDTAITVDDDDFVPLVGLTLVGPSGDPRDTPANTADTSTGIKVNGIRLDFHDIRVSSFGRGVDVSNNDTFSVSFVGGAIHKCYVCVWADQIGEATVENGEGITFERFTIYNSVRGMRITGNGMSVFFERCRIDYHLTRFGEIEDSWVYFTDCHIEVGSTQIAYLFDLDRNAHVRFTSCHIVMGAGSPNITHYLVNPAKAPWNAGYGTARFVDTDLFYVNPDGQSSSQDSELMLEFPANATAVTFHTAYPIRWCAVSAEFVASDFRPQSSFDRVRVSWADASSGLVTLTAAASSSDARFVRVKF